MTEQQLLVIPCELPEFPDNPFHFYFNDIIVVEEYPSYLCVHLKDEFYVFILTAVISVNHVSYFDSPNITWRIEDENLCRMTKLALRAYHEANKKRMVWIVNSTH
jgi:hypothetical protein